MPTPWEFQRIHSHALNVRLARVFIRAKLLQRVHGLYRIDGGGRGGGEPGVRAAHCEVFLAHRLATNAEDCAQAAVPYELEVIRMPAFGSIDPIAASSVTLTGYHYARACVPALYGPDGRANVQEFSMEEGVFASHWAQGGMPVPAPSALPSHPRAHGSTLAQAYSEYHAATELILSPYVPDAVGVHEEAATAITGVLGTSVQFCYEYLPGLVPLAQLLVHCGPLHEGRPFFRHLATSLCHAFCDIEAQCSLALVPGSITAENIYLSEGGNRLTLRGICWADPLPAESDGTASLLALRSACMMECLGQVMRACLPASVEKEWKRAKRRGVYADAVGMVVDGEDGDSSRSGNGQQEEDQEVTVYTTSAAVLGIHLTDVTACELQYESVEGCTWLPPVLQVHGAARPGVDSSIGEEALAALAVQLTPGSRVQDGTLDGGPVCRAQSRSDSVHLRGLRPGTATLHLYAVRGSDGGQGQGAGGGTGTLSEAARKVDELMRAAGFTSIPPSPSVVVQHVEVPLTVHPHEPSPVLAAILAACDPQPQESAPMATLKLLAAMHTAAGQRGKLLGVVEDPILDERALIETSRQVAALLGLTQAPASGQAAGGVQAGVVGGDAVMPAGSALSATVGPGAPLTAKSASSIAYGAVSDTDAVAALVAAIGKEAGQGDVPLGPAGSTEVEVGGHAGQARLSSGAPGTPDRILWLCHLALHPWFQAAPTEADNITQDYHAWTYKLRDKQAKAHGEKAVPA